MSSRTIFLFLSLLLSSRSITTSTSTSSPLNLVTGVPDDDANDDTYKCVYTLYVRTGSVWKGGTDSVIGVELAGADGRGVRITDLESWGGLMGAGHDYYERGSLDVFSGLGPCMGSAPCRMNLTSDGSGRRHGWYCNYVEATVTGPHQGCAQRLFTVEQWLATDASPYRLAGFRDQCRGARRVAAGGGGCVVTCLVLCGNK